MNEVSGIFLTSTLDYVARAAGSTAREAVLRAAGLADADCPVIGEWVTMATTLAVAHAAAAVMGDDDIGWRVGEELMRQSVETGFAQFLTETGSITAALGATAEYGSRMSNGRHHEVVDREPGQVTIESFYDPVPPSNFFCRLQAGYYASVPGAFGGTGFVSEPCCQLRGDSRCRFVVRWTGGDLGNDDIRAAARGTDAIVRQFEDMEEIAAELARAQDTEAALECIMARVGTATMAPRFLLAVHVGDTAPLRVHSRGFRAIEAADLAESILDGGDPPARWGEPVVVDVRGSQSFGILAAFLPPGTTTSGSEQRLLRAYAGHAASVLETAHALERARSDRDTAQVLLELAHGVARAHTSNEIAVTIAAAAGHLLGADYSTVWTWDPNDNVLHLAAAQPDVPDTPRSFNTMQAPALLVLRSCPRPLLMAAKQSKQMNANLMEHLGVETAAYVPVVARDDFLGLIAVGFAKPLDQLPQADVLERLSGLADLASAALDNARLLERIQQQASHDPLTGLPNRTIATAAAEESLATSPTGTGVLFIDLDDFKTINDEHGHRFGDQLLTVIAARMSGCMRANDTLTRFAGDEFVVIVGDCTSQADAEDVADRIRAILQHPMLVDDHLVTVSASVGVAFAAANSSDFESMLNAADSAMYINKHRKPVLGLPPVEQTRSG